MSFQLLVLSFISKNDLSVGFVIIKPFHVSLDVWKSLTWEVIVYICINSLNINYYDLHINLKAQGPTQQQAIFFFKNYFKYVESFC